MSLSQARRIIRQASDKATTTPTYYAFPVDGGGAVMGPYGSFDEALAELDKHAQAGLYTVTMKVMNHRVFRLVS